MSLLAGLSQQGEALTAHNADAAAHIRMTNPGNLATFRRKLAMSNFRQCNISIFGNSITGGYYATSNLTTDWPTFRERGFVGQLRKRFSGLYGDPGEGIIIGGDTRIVNNGAQVIQSIGISMRGGYRIAAAGKTVTYTTPECTEIWIHGWWESNAKCLAFTYSLDGGADVTADLVTLGSNVDYTVKLTGLTLQSHTLIIKPAATPTAQIDIAGVSCFVKSDSGVAVHRIGEGGGYLSTCFFPSGTTSGARGDRLSLGRLNTDLLVLAFGANECSVTGESVGHTPESYYTIANDIVTYATQTYGCDVLMLSLMHRSAETISTYGESAFYDVHEQLANENARVAHLSLQFGDFETFAAASAAGHMVDVIHPNLQGHSLIADVIFRELTKL